MLIFIKRLNTNPSHRLSLWSAALGNYVQTVAYSKAFENEKEENKNGRLPTFRRRVLTFAYERYVQMKTARREFKLNGFQMCEKSMCLFKPYQDQAICAEPYISIYMVFETLIIKCVKDCVHWIISQKHAV